jgi:hypothetical protein
MTQVQYEQGRASAEEVKRQHESSNYGAALAEYFAMAENRPLHTATDWFIRGYWDVVAETLSRTDKNAVVR